MRQVEVLLLSVAIATAMATSYKPTGDCRVSGYQKKHCIAFICFFAGNTQEPVQVPRKGTVFRR